MIRLLPLLFLSLLVSAQTQVRVLTYNIHHGEGADTKIDLERIAAVIKAVEPDLVAVQEVDVRNTRTASVDQTHELARLTGLHAIFGKTIDYRGGWYGNVILSKWPVGGFVSWDMPFTPGRERRGVIEGVIRPFPGTQLGGFHFMATHLDTTEPDRLLAIARIKELVTERPEGWPLILAGDLNAAPGSRTMNALFEDWQNAILEDPLHSFPANAPTRQIDFILFRPANRWKVVAVRVLDEAVASDHRPLFAVLELLPEP